MKDTLRVAIALTITATALVASQAGALAQIAHHPFAIGANEGAVGAQSGFGAWILAQESSFYRALTSAVAATKTSWSGLAALVGLSFGYGVFHAAGPGHGKAVITSYMVSNEVALRRGLIISGLAALLQGTVAALLVGIAAFLFNATAPRMTAAAETLELASYLGIVALGLVLVWRKGRKLFAVLRPMRRPLVVAPSGGTLAFDAPIGLSTTSRFVADSGLDHQHGPDCDCGHLHMPDPGAFETSRFDWKAAGTAVLTAGARPCSGAILVLVFALSQGIFLAGIAATYAMAIGTAVTTGALAATAVLAKDVAMRLSGTGSTRAAVVGRLVEFGAALVVLIFGLALLAAALSGVHAKG